MNQNDEHETGLYQTAKDLGHLVEIAVIILAGVVFFFAPAAVIRGEAEDRWTYVAGFVGILFWALAIGTLVGKP